MCQQGGSVEGPPLDLPNLSADCTGSASAVNPSTDCEEHPDVVEPAPVLFNPCPMCQQVFLLPDLFSPASQCQAAPEGGVRCGYCGSSLGEAVDEEAEHLRKCVEEARRRKEAEMARARLS